MTLEDAKETMKQLKQLHGIANAMLANSAYTLKAELRQMERLTSEIKRHDDYVEAGIVTKVEAETHQQDIEREKRLLKRIYRMRRQTAKALITEAERALDALESEDTTSES